MYRYNSNRKAKRYTNGGNFSDLYGNTYNQGQLTDTNFGGNTSVAPGFNSSGASGAASLGAGLLEQHVADDDPTTADAGSIGAGALKGAAAGAMFGPWGIAAGALIGGISTAFTAKKAKKEADKALEEAKGQKKLARKAEERNEEIKKRNLIESEAELEMTKRYNLYDLPTNSPIAMRYGGKYRLG